MLSRKVLLVALLMLVTLGMTVSSHQSAKRVLPLVNQWLDAIEYNMWFDESNLLASIFWGVVATVLKGAQTWLDQQVQRA
jgi:hypothetical protein